MLTPAQLQTLAGAIRADQDAAVVAALAIRNDTELARLYNAEASPAFYLWRVQYTPDQMRTAVMNGITQLDALTASKRDSLLWLVQGTVDMSKAATQAAINDLCGSQNTLKAALTDGGKRLANKVEKLLFATGTGSLASPATTAAEGTVSVDEVSRALNEF